MPISTTQTITDDAGNTYPFLALTLATSPRWEPGAVGASLAIRLIPYRVADGVVHAHPSADIAVVEQDAVAKAQTDPVLGLALMRVAEAVQAFVTAKGL